MRAFLRHLDQQASVEKWQVDQAEEALKLLYQKLLRESWAQEWPDKVSTIRADE